MRYNSVALNNPIEIKHLEGGSILEQARLRQSALAVELARAEAPHPSAEEMQQRQPELDARLASLGEGQQMVLAGIAEAVLNKKK